MIKREIVSIAVAASCFVFACSNEDDSAKTNEVDLTAMANTADVHVNTSSLPQPVLDYITENYPEQTIWKAEMEENTNYEVKLSNGAELIFDAEGNFLGIDDDGENDFGDRELAASELSQTITEFLEKYYPGASVEEAEVENNGHVKVELDNDTELIFDAEGNFLGQATDEQGDEDEGDEDIAIADLPQTIKDYIATNYPDNSIVEAEKEDEGYEVSLNDGNELKFDAEGNFVSAEDHNGDDDGNNEEEDD